MVGGKVSKVLCAFQPGSHWHQVLTQMLNQPQVKINCLDSCQMRFSAWFLTIYSKVLCVSHPGSHWRQGLVNADVKPATSEDELF